MTIAVNPLVQRQTADAFNQSLIVSMENAIQLRLHQIPMQAVIWPQVFARPNPAATPTKIAANPLVLRLRAVAYNPSLCVLMAAVPTSQHLQIPMLLAMRQQVYVRPIPNVS
jgi:hypothetical protein